MRVTRQTTQDLDSVLNILTPGFCGRFGFPRLRVVEAPRHSLSLFIF